MFTTAQNITNTTSSLNYQPYYMRSASIAYNIRLVITASITFGEYATKMYFTNYNNSTNSWNNQFIWVANQDYGYNTITLSEDGTILLYSLTNGGIYFYRWNGTTYGNLTTIILSIRIKDIVISKNKERIVATTFFSPYNIHYFDISQNTYALKESITRSGISGFYGLDISPNLNMIVFTELVSSNYNTYSLTWDGISYSNNITTILSNTSQVSGLSFLMGYALFVMAHSNSRVFIWNNNNKSFSIPISFNNNSGLSYANSFSYNGVAVSIRYDSNVSRNQIQYQSIFSLFNGNNYYLFKDISNISFTDNLWKHIVWTISSTNTWKFYINSVLTKTYTGNGVNGSFIPSLLQRNNNNIGSNDFLYSILNNYSGGIDEFAFYNKELSQAEITNIYNTKTHPII